MEKMQGFLMHILYSSVCVLWKLKHFYIQCGLVFFLFSVWMQLE